jgi:hypothetical protein
MNTKEKTGYFIITYTFKDEHYDEKTRFIKLLESLKFEKASDQSTYFLRETTTNRSEIVKNIREKMQCTELGDDEHITGYYSEKGNQLNRIYEVIFK